VVLVKQLSQIQRLDAPNQCEISGLTELGHLPIEAGDGTEGLKILQSREAVDLLVTDVGLPGGMNGRQLADAGKAIRPALKVLFITGYAENAVIGQGRLDPDMHVLTKPFTVDNLANRVAGILKRG
jgi:CheY-like chemotaxis protein